MPMPCILVYFCICFIIVALKTFGWMLNQLCSHFILTQETVCHKDCVSGTDENNNLCFWASL